jgi:DNA-binding transcriptional regulator YiaG
MKDTTKKKMSKHTLKTFCLQSVEGDIQFINAYSLQDAESIAKKYQGNPVLTEIDTTTNGLSTSIDPLVKIKKRPRHTGQIVSYIRRGKELTQASIAKELGISTQNLSNWEGKQPPSLKKMVEVLKVMGVSPHVFVEVDIDGETLKLLLSQ